jgi:hypothetical protein
MSMLYYSRDATRVRITSRYPKAHLLSMSRAATDEIDPNFLLTSNPED